MALSLLTRFFDIALYTTLQRLIRRKSLQVSGEGALEMRAR